MKIPHYIFKWVPRILCIWAILFISMFALDAFRPGVPLLQQWLHFALHLIPSYVLLAIFMVAWKWEKIGGIVFIAIGLLCTPLVYWINYNRTHSVWIGIQIIAVITFPFMVLGVLYIISSRLNKRDMDAIL